MVCKIADIVVEFLNVPPEAESRFMPFKTDGQPQISLAITEEDIDYETQLVNGNCTRLNSILTAYLRKLVECFVNFDILLLHASLIDVCGVGVAFLAPSGTGKTTHTLLWKKLLGEKVTVINGDKPFVRFLENQKFPIGYGTPWKGKERLGNTSKIPIEHLCFIERAESNSCERLEAKDVIELFFKQLNIQRNSAQSVSKGLKFSDNFLKQVAVWKIKCNMDIEAAEVAYNTILGEFA